MHKTILRFYDFMILHFSVTLTLARKTCKILRSGLAVKADYLRQRGPTVRIPPYTRRMG